MWEARTYFLSLESKEPDNSFLLYILAASFVAIYASLQELYFETKNNSFIRHAVTSIPEMPVHRFNVFTLTMGCKLCIPLLEQYGYLIDYEIILYLILS